MDAGRQKAVQSGKPEGDAPAASHAVKHGKDLGPCRGGLIALFRVQSIEREVICAVVLDHKDRLLPLPLAWLRAWIVFAVAGEPCDLGGTDVVTAVQDLSLGVGLHAGLQ